MILTGSVLLGYGSLGEEASMAKLYRVELREPERPLVLALMQKGRAPGRKLRRAPIFLAAADGQSEATSARVLHSSVSTLARTRKRFVEAGLEAALPEHPRPGARRKLDGQQAAFRIALAWSEPPAGRLRWTMPLFANRVLELGVVAAMSDATVRRLLKQPPSSRG
jgi:transposase